MSGVETCPGPWAEQEAAAGPWLVMGRAGHAGQGFVRMPGKRMRARWWWLLDIICYPIKGLAHQSVKRRVYRADSSELFLQLPRQGLDSVMKCASYLSLHLCQTDGVFLVCYDWENFSSVRKISRLVSGVKGSESEWVLLNKDDSVQVKIYMEKNLTDRLSPRLCLHLGPSEG